MSDAVTAVYRKHNSFVDLRNCQKNLQEQVIARIKALQHASYRYDNLSAKHQIVLDHAIHDILADELSPAPCLRLSPNVNDEINTCTDAELPKYLVHRYRYEIFPQLAELDDYPPYLQIEPSSICNYRCVFCFESDSTFTKRSSGFMGYMPFELFKRIIDEIQGEVEFISLASRGEPLLCPDIEKMLSYTRGKFLNLKLNTNASLLDENKCHAILQGGVKTLVFSVDAASEPLYSKLRVGGQLDNVLANIERFHKIRTTQYPDANIITRVSGVKISDQQDLDLMQSVWGGLADQVAFVHYNPWEDSYNSAINGITSSCTDLWRRMFVWWDGKMNPCDVDYKSTLLLGNFNDGGIHKSWCSEGYAVLRTLHLNAKRQTKEPCCRCSVV